MFTSMVGVTIIGILVALITRSMGLKWPYVYLLSQLVSHPQVTSLSLPLCSAMAFTIALSFVLEVLNVYCMVPLIWLANHIH